MVVAILYFSQSGQATTPDTGASNVQDVYGFSELLYLASQAGFGQDSSTAAAIALAESGGKRTIIGDRDLAPTNGPAIGLWQINLAKHPEYTEDQLFDPQVNAAEAYKIYSDVGNDFTAWTTYSYRDGVFQGHGQGVYQDFLQ